MKKLILLTFSSLLLSTSGFCQTDASQSHPTNVAIEKWLNNETRGGNRAAPQICMVSIDLLSTHNIIYWEEAGMGDVDYFKIYRENASGGYDSIGVRSVDSLSEYHDYGFTVHPNYGSSRYKISAVDTNGIEGPQSLYHQTIFCDEPVEGDFDWTDYEIEGTPNPVVDFVLLRMDTIGAPWQPIDTVSSITTAFTDINHALFPAGEWRVRTLWPITCTTSRAGISTSRSNLRNKSMLMTTPSMLANTNSFSLYPNPANDNIVVEFAKSPGELNIIIITDASGRIVDQKTTIYYKVQFNLNNLAKGTYFVNARNSLQSSTKLFIKN